MSVMRVSPPSISLTPTREGLQDAPFANPLSHQSAPFSPITASFSASGHLSPVKHGRSVIEEEVDDGHGHEHEQIAFSNPFNFQTTSYSIGPAPVSATKGDLGRRRGHKYVRSSISHEIILSPAPRTPLQVPVSLPMPTLKEITASMTTQQRVRWAWCFCHLGVAGYVQMKAHESQSVTALSHLIFFDALGAFLCMVVDTARNFEVWSRSTISRPFGLERSEVLAGLAMSIILFFMGFDLISHGLTHAFENSNGHASHHHGEHSHHGLDSVNFAALAAIMSTFISTSMLGNHDRIGRAIRIPKLDSLPAPIRNPNTLLPISLASLVLILPLFGIHMSGTVDALLGFFYASGMVILGGCLCYGVGRMLLMSYNGRAVQELTEEISTDKGITGVEEAKVWQVHYGLCMANFKLKVNNAENVERLRERIVSLVRNKLGGEHGEGSKGVKWEVSTQITIDR